MSCPHRLSSSTSKRKHRTPLGYRTFFCPSCGRRFNERTGSPFNDLQFPTDIVLLAVLWRLRYKLSFRDVAELLLQRGFEISHETIRVWEFRFAPLVSENLRSKRRGTAGSPGTWTRPTSRSAVTGITCTVPSTEMGTCSIRCSVNTGTSMRHVVSCVAYWIVQARSRCA